MTAQVWTLKNSKTSIFFLRSHSKNQFYTPQSYVERKQNPEDRRAVIISLTKEGEKFIEKYFPVHLNNIVHEFSALTSEELETLAALCKKVGKAE